MNYAKMSRSQLQREARKGTIKYTVLPTVTPQKSQLWATENENTVTVKNAEIQTVKKPTVIVRKLIRK